jgi:protocatechuate 3,4-dioxygenase beta subunit
MKNNSSNSSSPAKPRFTTRLNRREVIQLLGKGVVAGAFLFLQRSLWGCSSFSQSKGNSNLTEKSASCPLIPDAEAGPFPADGSNGPDDLNMVGILRKDITDGQIGTPLNFQFTVLDEKCQPVKGAAIYIWHCNRNGEYSSYSDPHMGDYTDENFCRGVQLSDAQGNVTFQTIFPGWYEGRVTHAHLEIYLNGNYKSCAPDRTTQVCFPESITRATYANAHWYPKGQNTSVPSVADDYVFSEGATHQTCSVTNDSLGGLVASLRLPVVSPAKPA